MKWGLTSEEAEKLRGLDVYAQLMYTLHFRRFVNFNTGLYDYRMSTQGWKELLAFEPERGSNRTNNGLPNEGKGKKFENFLAARKKQLIRAGLLVKLDSYAYQLPLTGIFSSNEEQVIEATSKQPENTPETPLNQQLSNLEKPMSKGMNQPPQVFNNKQTHNSGDYFEITVNWKPSEHFKALALLSGFDIEQDDKALYQTALANFLLYWSSPEAINNADIQTNRSQQAWERRLIEDLKYHSSNTAIKPIKTVVPKPKPVNNDNNAEISPVIAAHINPDNQQACQNTLNSLSSTQAQDVLDVFSDVVNSGKVKSSSSGLFVTLCEKARQGALIKNEEQSTPTHASHKPAKPQTTTRTASDVRSDIAMLEMTARFSRISVKQAAENMAMLKIHDEAKKFGITISNW